MTPITIAPGELRARLDAVEAAGTGLRALSADERIAVVARVAARWQEPQSPWRRRALAALPAATGYAHGAIVHAIDALFAALSARELGSVAARELGNGTPERLALHSLAGNVPGVGVFGIVAALIAGVPSVVKTARREPLVPALLAETFAAEDPRVGSALAVVHWPGGSESHETIALDRSSVVLAYGRDATLDRLAAHAPRRLLRFGPRLSIAVVCRAHRDTATAATLALQAALFDQHGCLSPQYVVLEEDDPATTDAFVAAVAAAFARLAVTVPRASLSLAEAADAWRFRERQCWRAQEGAAVRVLTPDDASFAVVCDRTGAPPTSPLNRHLIVLPVTSVEDAALILRPFAGSLEAVGVAAPAGRLGAIASLATECGAHRLCPLERMQAPPFGWRQSGHARLASLLVPPARAADAGVTSAASVGVASPSSSEDELSIMDADVATAYERRAERAPIAPGVS